MISRQSTLFTAVALSCLLASLAGPGAEAKEEGRPSLGARGGEGTLFICERPLPPTVKASDDAAPDLKDLPTPLEDTFLLHSNPSSDQILYLDFNGYEEYWTYLTPFDMDGDESTFNDTERTVIQETWRAVAEDFLPFDVDITTEEPPSGFLGQRAVIDGSDLYEFSWAYGGAWANPYGEIAYCYHGDDTWEWICHSISHEVGHTLDLDHHGSIDDGAYYMGHGTGDTEWCAIMGWGAWSLNNWSFDGEYFEQDATTPGQFDLAVIDNVSGVDFRPDDHGSSTGTATPIAFAVGSLEFAADGIIERPNDVDYFAFTTFGGNVQFSINEDAVIGSTNLDVLAQIHDSGGAVLYTSNPIDYLYASFDVTLTAGQYYLSIDGTGMGDPHANPPIGYSDYGSLGYYSIYASGKADPDSKPPTPDPMTWALEPTAEFTPPTTLASLTGNEDLTTTPLASQGTEEVQLANLLNDEFAYNPDNPTSPMPVLDDEWFHGLSEELSTIAYDLDDVYDDLYVDLYGRSSCCLDRDDSFNVQFWLGGVLQEAVAGSIDGDFHGRVVASPDTEADQIRIVETAVTPNYLTLSEIRVYSCPFPPLDTDTMIVMIASTASDIDGVQYFFACTAGGGNDSGWQDSPIYVDMGLTPGTQYTYQVLAGDKSGEQNLTDWSVAASATTTYKANGDPVPDFVGMKKAAAKSAIAAAGFAVGTIDTAYSDSVSKGTVISQYPASGTYLFAGASVNLVVSSGIRMVTVPDVVDMDQATAEADISAAILTVDTVTTEFSDTVPAGYVIRQNPVAGASVVNYTAVDIVISRGVKMAVVPDVLGMTQAGAEWAIETAHLTVGSVTTASSDTVPAGKVISQSLSADANVALDTPVDLIISEGDTTPPNPNPATWAIAPVRVVSSS